MYQFLEDEGCRAGVAVGGVLDPWPGTGDLAVAVAVGYFGARADGGGHEPERPGRDAACPGEGFGEARGAQGVGSHDSRSGQGLGLGTEVGAQADRGGGAGAGEVEVPGDPFGEFDAGRACRQDRPRSGRSQRGERMAQVTVVGDDGGVAIARCNAAVGGRRCGGVRVDRDGGEVAVVEGVGVPGAGLGGDDRDSGCRRCAQGPARDGGGGLHVVQVVV
ncbi:hypothetical protein ACIQVK_38405 [Streptomyces sp. NPDC090493]|uniref:hypothetical protein n=1 Tax=Streptomyces sp. NPDC090493 TaxID=3365964 RepID=UPI0037FD5891